VQIRGASRIGSGARLCHAVVDETTVGAGGQVVRSALRRSCVGDGAAVTSCLLEQAQVAARSTADCARVVRASLRGAARLNPYALIEDAHLEFPCIVGSSIRGARIRSTFMSYHMPGQVEGLVVEPTCVSVDGQRVAVAAVPMLGGGLRVQGDAERPVTMECAFIGSNAILEAGARVGFGCFVLGRLTGVEGLPPFTVSVAAGPEADGIGMVVHQFANMVITHFINWAYQALGPAQAEAVGLLVPTMLAEGRAAVAWALAQRAAGRRWPADAPFAKYRSLALYSEAQLAAGLDAYERALADDRWQMRFVDGELRFTGHGRWEAAAGAARWRPAAPGQ